MTGITSSSMAPCIPQDSAGAPGPPRTIEFPLHSGAWTARYHQSVHKQDGDAGVLGKGGFGCVYRYAIDDSFTPPSSLDLTQTNESVSDRDDAIDVHSRRLLSTIHDQREKNRIHVPSVVAVKLCRTPCSGSFDELPKTGLQDKKTRRTDMLDDRLSHVRIVRGEGRIFQYLQAARQRSSRLQDPPLVKLLANLPPSGLTCSSSDLDNLLDNGSTEDDSEIDDGPPTRLLVFEKMVELDYEQTALGWVKSQKPWTHDQVEKAAIEVVQGLQFLHEHNVTHGDLKPSNLMLDPRTGAVKIIDLGASRRFVMLSNRERNNRSAVEEQDGIVLSRQECVAQLDSHHCEGLGSLTGSPYYMAPEILLQATRYTDVTGRSRSVLEDYENDYRMVLAKHEWPLFHIGLNDLRRGWGIRADVWSWACTVQALLLRTVPAESRPSTSSVSPFDFSFSKHQEEMLEPRYEKMPEEEHVPRFHQWCRALPLLIVRVTLEPAKLPAEAETCSEWLKNALRKALCHQDRRPTADDICKFLETREQKTNDGMGQGEKLETLETLSTTSALYRDSKSVSVSSGSDGCVSTSDSRADSILPFAVCTADIDTSSRVSALTSGFDMIQPRPSFPPKREPQPTKIESCTEPSLPPQPVEQTQLPRPPLPCKLAAESVSRAAKLPYWANDSPRPFTHWRNSSLPVTAMGGMYSKIRAAVLVDDSNNSLVSTTPARQTQRPSTANNSIRQSTFFSTFRDRQDKLRSRLASPTTKQESRPAVVLTSITLSPKRLFRRLFTWQASSPRPATALSHPR